ncbi:MAG: SseB family protein [Candidatus Dormibacteraeota bacterium]|nr:SseB family protein [Candidatus Dormibacteraeota bacterium]
MSEDRRPPTNPELLEAMRQGSASAGPEAHRSLLRAFTRSVVSVPTRQGPRGPELVAVAGRDGRPVLIVFTDEDAMRRWSAGTITWAAIAMPDLCQEALDRRVPRIAVNPSGPWGGTLDERDIEILAAGHTLGLESIDASGGAELSVKDAAGYTMRPLQAVRSDLVAAIRATLMQHLGIEAVYLLEVTGAGSPHPALGLVLAGDADAAQAARSMAGAVQPLLPRSQFVDIFPLSAQQATSLDRVMEPLAPDKIGQTGNSAPPET